MILSFEFVFQSKVASAGNRTRAARVAGEHSTTEPPMLTHFREGLTSWSFGVQSDISLTTCILYWWCAGPLSLVGRNSSVGRALDWRSKGPWFNPGFRQCRNTRRSTPHFLNWYQFKSNIIRIHIHSCKSNWKHVALFGPRTFYDVTYLEFHSGQMSIDFSNFSQSLSSKTCA